jgi:GMP synthase (glutamine-hydrolysing)
MLASPTLSTLRFLVLDAYAREGRDALRAAGATRAGTLYARLLRRCRPDAAVDVVFPADADAALPSGAALRDYDGVCWTGSSLTIHADDARVRRQLELARGVYAAGVPSFGSCWAAQVAVVAAGGVCAASPKGREFGIARRITLNQEGRAHALFGGKPAVFDALASHADEAVTLPPGARLLASNDWSRVQAIAVEHGPGSFWAVQYHPEWDLRELAALTRLRSDELVAQGHFEDRVHADRHARELEALAADPTRRDLAEALQIASELLDPDEGARELGNWIEHQVLAHAAR